MAKCLLVTQQMPSQTLLLRFGVQIYCWKKESPTKTDIYTFVYSKRQTPLSGGKMIMYYSARPSGLKISICTASVPIITKNYSTSGFSAFCISGLTRIFSEERSVNCHIWSFKFIFEFFNHQSEQIFNILYCQGLHITPSPVGPGDFFLPPG